MKPRRTLSFMILLVMMVTIFPAAQASEPSIPQLKDGYINLPIIHQPITPAAPIAEPIEAPKPEPEPEPEAASPKLKLQVSVNKTKAQTGDTLHFSASASGGKGQKKFALWLYRDGEQVEYFSTSQKSKWSYVAVYEGKYHAQVVAKDEAGKQTFQNSPVIVVTLNAEEEFAKRSSPMGRGGGENEAANPQEAAAVMTLGPIKDVTILETKSFQMNIPFEPDPHFFKKDGSLTKGTWFNLDSKSIFPLFSLKWNKVRGRQTPVFVYTFPVLYPQSNSLLPNPFGTWKNKADSAYDKWLNEQDNKKTIADVGLWKGNEFERTFEIIINAFCVHGGKDAHQVSASFTLRILRDSNRNGIADKEENLATSNLAFLGVPDVVMVESPPDLPVNSRFPAVPIRAIHTSGKASPISYWAEGMPSGISFDQVIGGDYPVYRFWGEARKLAWQPMEIMRVFPMTVYAKDTAGNHAKMTLLLTILRHSNRYQNLDINLSIDKVPDLVLLEGQKTIIPDKLVTVMTNSREPVKLNLYASPQFFGNSDLHDPAYQPVSLAPYSVTIPIYTDPWADGYQRITKWKLVSSPANLTLKWEKNRTFRQYQMMLVASQGDKEVKSYFTVTVLRADQSGKNPLGQFYFEPIQNIHVQNGDHLKGQATAVKVGPERMRGFTYIQVPALPGVRLNETYLRLDGRTNIKNWREGETVRAHATTFQAEGVKQRIQPDKGDFWYDNYYIASTSFTIFVYRKYSEYDRDFEPIADQTVEDGESILPFKPHAKPGPVPMTLQTVSGYPPGVEAGPGGYYEGKVNITDWKEGEMQRAYPVFVRGAVRSGSDGRFEDTRWQEMQFTITVLRTGFGSAPEEPESAAPPQENQADQPPQPPQEGAALPEEAAQPLPEVAPEKEGQKQQDQQGSKPDAQAQNAGTQQADPGQQAPDTAESTPIARPVTAADFAPQSTRFTEAQKALPRLGILLPDERADSLKTYQGILTALVQSGYTPNENIVMLVVSAGGKTGSAAEQKAALLKSMGCNLVIAVGEAMGKSAVKELKDIPLVVAGVDNPRAAGFVDGNGKPKGKLTGVINAPIFSQLLALALQMQPEGNKAGLMYILEAQQASERAKTLKNAGMEIVYGKMHKESSLEETAKKLYQKTDFLLLDQSLDILRSAEDLAGMGQSSLETGGKPLYGTTAAQLDAGCAAVCMQDHEALGQQAGELAIDLLSGQDIKNLPFAPLTDSVIKLNPRAMDAFGLIHPFPSLIPLFQEDPASQPQKQGP